MKVRLASGKLLLRHFWSFRKRIHTETVGRPGSETAKSGRLRRKKGTELKVLNVTFLKKREKWSTFSPSAGFPN